MKKIAKMSLVAAVALTGLVSTASASSLEQAVANTDVSGFMTYRYDDRAKVKIYNFNGNAAQTREHNNEYKAQINFKSKVNDDITANTSVIYVESNQMNIHHDNRATSTANPSTNTEGKDGSNGVNIAAFNFAYTGLQNTVITLGRQAIDTPWTNAADSIGSVDTGTGITAVSKFGPVTGVLGFFNDNNGNTGWGNGLRSNDIYTAILKANFANIGLEAGYLNQEDQFDTYTVAANAGFEFSGVKLGLDARYTSLDADSKNTYALNDKKDNALTQFGASLEAGIFDASVRYAFTDKDGGMVATDSSSKTSTDGWSSVGLGYGITSNATIDKDGNISNPYADANALYTKIGVQVLPSVNVSAHYDRFESDFSNLADNQLKKADEYYLHVDYKMSKNLDTFVRFGQRDLTYKGHNGEDGTLGRFQVKYSF